MLTNKRSQKERQNFVFTGCYQIGKIITPCIWSLGSAGCCLATFTTTALSFYDLLGFPMTYSNVKQRFAKSRTKEERKNKTAGGNYLLMNPTELSTITVLDTASRTSEDECKW